MSDIRFYRATGEYGWLSNLWPCEVVVEDVLYPDVERAYQIVKSSDPAIQEWLRAAPTASLCAQAAHALLPWQVRKDWNDIKVPRMRACLLAKFTQHEDLRRKLIDTGDATLVEESKSDAFWGVGKKGTGKNMLGVLLCQLRAELRKAETT